MLDRQELNIKRRILIVCEVVAEYAINNPHFVHICLSSIEVRYCLLSDFDYMYISLYKTKENHTILAWYSLNLLRSTKYYL